MQKTKSGIVAFKQIFESRTLTPGTQLIRTIFIAVITILSISLIWWFIRRFINNFGTVFNVWDAVISWNTWAQYWAQSIIPYDSGLYPQLIPINLSIPYVLIDNIQINFFSKAIMPIFSILIVLVLFETALKNRSYGFLIAIIFVYLLFKKFLGDYISEAVVDIPLAFISLMATLIYLRTNNILNNRKELLLLFLFAATAFVTKQPGVFLLVVLPVLVLFTGTRDKNSLRHFFLFAGIAALIVLAGYYDKIIPALTDSIQFKTPDYLAITTRANESESIIGNIRSAFVSLDKYLILFVFIIPAAIFLPNKHRLVIFTIIIPFLFLWSAFASYDFRNLALVYPLVALMAGLGIERFGDLILDKLDRWKFGRIPSWIIPGLALIGLLLLGFVFTKENITVGWKTKQKQIFSPEINEQIYALDMNGLCRIVLTNYPVGYLPGLEENQKNFYYDDYDAYMEYIQDPTICWLFIPPYAEQSIQDEITRNLENGTYELLYTNENWIQYRLIKIR